MSPQTLAKLAGALGALVLLTLAAAWLTRQPSIPTLAPEGFADKATRIEVEGPGGKLELKRDKGTWLSCAPSGFPADGKTVDELLGRLPRSTVSEPLTEDAQRYPLFGFEADKATRVRLFTAGGEPALDFFVGKDGPDYPSAFVRLAKQTGVVQVSGVSATEWSRPPGDWLSKTVTPGPPDGVTTVSVRGAKGSWELKLSSGAWLLGGKPVGKEAADRLVRQAREAAGGLEADSVLDAARAPKDIGLDKPELQVLAQTGSGPVSYAVGKKDPSGRRYVKKGGEERVLYLVSDWKLDPLRKPAAEFLKK